MSQLSKIEGVTCAGYNAPGPSDGHAERPRSPEHRPRGSTAPADSQGHRGKGGRRSTPAQVTPSQIAGPSRPQTGVARHRSVPSSWSGRARTDPPCLDDEPDVTLADDLAMSLTIVGLSRLSSLR